MNGFRHILVPIDFGEPAMNALDTAVTLAAKFDAQVTLMHAYVLAVTPYTYGEAFYYPSEQIENASKAALDGALTTARVRYPKIDGVLACGEPWRKILEVAKERQADLIVMGTHGRRWLSRVLLGSVAEKVVRMSPVPVLTVPGKEQRQAKEKLAIEPAV